MFRSFTAQNIETILEHVFSFQDSPFDNDTLTFRKCASSILTLTLAHSLCTR